MYALSVDKLKYCTAHERWAIQPSRAACYTTNGRSLVWKQSSGYHSWGLASCSWAGPGCVPSLGPHEGHARVGVAGVPARVRGHRTLDAAALPTVPDENRNRYLSSNQTQRRHGILGNSMVLSHHKRDQAYLIESTAWVSSMRSAESKSQCVSKFTSAEMR